MAENTRTGPSYNQAEDAFTDGFLNVSDFLYVLRDEAGSAAERLGTKITQMQTALDEARRVHDRLHLLAHKSERAAEREAGATND